MMMDCRYVAAAFRGDKNAFCSCKTAILFVGTSTARRSVQLRRSSSGSVRLSSAGARLIILANDSLKNDQL